jgi:hypothetical protein
MKRLMVALVVAGGLLAPSPALADHDYDERDRDRYGHSGGDYGGNERDEEYGDNSCKYVCPDFKDSPVHDAFNFAPQVCLPGATCYWDGQRDERREEGQPEGR